MQSHWKNKTHIIIIIIKYNFLLKKTWNKSFPFMVIIIESYFDVNRGKLLKTVKMNLVKKDSNFKGILMGTIILLLKSKLDKQ